MVAQNRGSVVLSMTASSLFTVDSAIFAAVCSF